MYDLTTIVMKADKHKTGQLIAEKRKQKQMSQLDLAASLHVTSKAVSKW